MRSRDWWFAIVVSALGYFVDVYDIILFSAVRVPSLRDIGIPETEITSVAIQLINIQVLGMVIGGIAWGMLGDRRGRQSVLFGSILLYSLATFANAFVTSLPLYAVLRFIAGFGLAGELGAGITLVSELMSREKRGYGTTLIVVAGALGCLAGGIVGNVLHWKTAYILGGVGGFILLLLRLQVSESKLFMSLKEDHKTVRRGSLRMLFHSPSMLIKYVKCLCVGLPFWIFVGLFLALAPELGKAIQVSVPITAPKTIMYFSVGLVVGECISGLLSQWWRTRKKIVQLYLSLCLGLVVSFLYQTQMSESAFYGYCLVFGFSSGFWVLFVLIAAEQFGTNMRATVTTSLPNLVRAVVLPSAIGLSYLKGQLGILPAFSTILIGSLVLALTATYFLKETYAIDLDFIES